MAVIYKATNKLNGKAYVGFTRNTAEDRFTTHCERGNSLHQAIKKHGAENFEVSVLEESEDWLYLVTVREPYYIKSLNTMVPNGYNKTKGGEYSNPDGVPVDVYDLDLQFVETVKSISECARKYNVPHSNIQGACANARKGKASRLGDHHFCYNGESVKKRVWNTDPGLQAAIKSNIGRKKPAHSEFMRKRGEERRDTTVHTFLHKDGKSFTGTRHALKEIDPTVSIGELGVLIKGGYKSHRGWRIGK